MEKKGALKPKKKKKKHAVIVPEVVDEEEYQTWAMFGDKWCASTIGRWHFLLLIAGAGEIALGILLWGEAAYTWGALRRGTWWTGVLEMIQGFMGLILWGSIEDQQMQNFMGTCEYQESVLVLVL